jgi:threonine synthase
MWPWETEPVSVASGILDDETHDWFAVTAGMIGSGGWPLVLDEEALAGAHERAQSVTGIVVCATGAAGLAGVHALRAAGEVGADEQVAVLFTGAQR